MDTTLFKIRLTAVLRAVWGLALAVLYLGIIPMLGPSLITMVSATVVGVVSVALFALSLAQLATATPALDTVNLVLYHATLFMVGVTLAVDKPGVFSFVMLTILTITTVVGIAAGLAKRRA